MRGALASIVSMIALMLLTSASARAQYDRQWKIFLIPYSHTDVGYNDAVPAVIDAHNRYLDTVIAYVNRTAGNPEGERFR